VSKCELTLCAFVAINWCVVLTNRYKSKEQKHGTPSFQTEYLLGACARHRPEIDDSDTVTAIESARYRFQACMSDLEHSYDIEASKLRAAFVAEVAALYQGEVA